MPQTTLSRQQIRLVDKLAVEEYDMDGIVLMENAGRGCTDKLEELGIEGPVVVCCGAGNNGGDGFVIARHLELRGHDVRLGLWADPIKLQGDADVNYHILGHCQVQTEVFEEHDPERLDALLEGADWIVDALLGTGAKGDPRPPLDQVIDAINAHSARTLAVDLPSGLDCDSGKAGKHTVRASHTCTFVAAKPGLLTAEGKKYTGQVTVHDIGTPIRLIDDVLAS